MFGMRSQSGKQKEHKNPNHDSSILHRARRCSDRTAVRQGVEIPTTLDCGRSLCGASRDRHDMFISAILIAIAVAMGKRKQRAHVAHAQQPAALGTLASQVRTTRHTALSERLNGERFSEEQISQSRVAQSEPNLSNRLSGDRIFRN